MDKDKAINNLLDTHEFLISSLITHKSISESNQDIDDTKKQIEIVRTMILQMASSNQHSD